MLALDFIKANRETVERAIRDKGVDLDLTHLLDMDAEVRGLKTEIDRLRAERNAVSARFKDASPEEKVELGRKAREEPELEIARQVIGAARQLQEDARKQGIEIELIPIPREEAP